MSSGERHPWYSKFIALTTVATILNLGYFVYQSRLVCVSHADGICSNHKYCVDRRLDGISAIMPGVLVAPDERCTNIIDKIHGLSVRRITLLELLSHSCLDPLTRTRRRAPTHDAHLPLFTAWVTDLTVCVAEYTCTESKFGMPSAELPTVCTQDDTQRGLQTHALEFIDADRHKRRE